MAKPILPAGPIRLICDKCGRKGQYWGRHVVQYLKSAMQAVLPKPILNVMRRGRQAVQQFRYTVRQRQQKKRDIARSAQEIFSEVYEKNIWGGAKGEMYSGAGSRFVPAELYAKTIIKFIKDHSISTVLDLGCGDFEIGKKIAAACNEYIGVDVVPELINLRQPGGLDGLCEISHIDAMRFRVGEPRPLIWRGTSKSDYMAFPATVQREMGYALFLAQAGKRHATMAKTLKGFGGGTVVEVKESFAGNAYRAIYTVRFAEAVYVLHAFQKKSKTGVKTPKVDVNLIEKRLNDLIEERERRG